MEMRNCNLFWQFDMGILMLLLEDRMSGQEMRQARPMYGAEGIVSKPFSFAFPNQ